MIVLVDEAAEDVTFQAVVLDVLHSAFDLALVLGSVRLGRNERGAVVCGERLKLRMDLGIVPISSPNGRFEVVNYQPLGHTTEVVKCVFKGSDKVVFLYFPHAMPHKPLAVSGNYYTPDTPDDLYADVIRELDWSVAKVRKALEARGILDNTILIFTSDNGPHYGGSTGGLKGKKATPWEGGTRVPFIIRYPLSGCISATEGDRCAYLVARFVSHFARVVRA